MAKPQIKSLIVTVCSCLGIICFGGMITFFVLGGTFFAREHPKVLNYANSMCRVDSISYKTYQCRSRRSQYNCYGPIWDVRHGANKMIFAQVQGDNRYRSSLDALKKAQEYQVTKPTK